MVNPNAKAARGSFFLQPSFFRFSHYCCLFSPTLKSPEDPKCFGQTNRVPRKKKKITHFVKHFPILSWNRISHFFMVFSCIKCL
ncbi:uncharacterized protein ASCRUDRAFT_110010 [Ascoidea rubescens DSM 1968]|uniref:Uncharacterized protein n=1 Tax=Ascoidea rubescens DSM 1968 TaxID=1344418 RepID=A0A1D2VDD5_9ASCO|nr:hypothetical protein ASCRUDRAFT_110010 [Ascoidea rubescens DSM 1968]ODV59609.1 hypothetical protein ASCRUDRAFT_110010 [Ascoidea rubescens DSM 1968]